MDMTSKELVRLLKKERMARSKARRLSPKNEKRTDLKTLSSQYIIEVYQKAY